MNPIGVAALAGARSTGVPARDVLIPRAGANSAQEASALAQGHVTPLYGQDTPAPIGLAYYGLSAASNGSVQATTLQSQKLLATFDPNATGVVSAYPMSSSPDAYGVQLNAVTTNINLFGTAGYSFWTQNVAEFYPSNGSLYLVTNVWNFSSTSVDLTPNAIYAHGPYGQVVQAPGLDFYYAELLVKHVSYPFDLDLWMNNSVASGRNEVSFTVGLLDRGNTTIYAYDYVIFNSVSASVSDYTANGSNYNVLGLTNDFELILGGPGGGAQSDLFAADANLTLEYWDALTAQFRAVPAAYSYGGETGETVTGAYVGWSTNATSGEPYGILRSGPAFLQGLWNATGAKGVTPVTVAVTPANAFFFLAINWTTNFAYPGELYWAPQERDGGTFYLAPGEYNLTVVLSDYDPGELAFTVGTNAVRISGTLVANSSLGIYTPLWAWNNDQFAAISTGGSGTPAQPYRIVNTQPYDILAIFGFFNDYTFPVYSGVFFWGTTANVVLAGMPSMVAQMPYTYFPSTNDLAYLFYNARNIALVNSSEISGWFTSNLLSSYPGNTGAPFNGNFYGTFSVEVWNSSFVLVDNDTFRSQAAGMVLAAGGLNNTVWGNRFTMAAEPPWSSTLSNLGIDPLNLSLGLEEAEQGDLIYNNAFTTTTTAVNAPYDLYTGAFVPFENTWNISAAPASAVRYAAGFPEFPLTGSIVGGTVQGGNYWWDYGTASNPTGVLPYDEYNASLGQAQIAYGGDYLPLVYITKYSVTFQETGLPANTPWNVTLGGTVYRSTTSRVSTTLVNGTYLFTVPDQGGLVPDPSAGTVQVKGAPVTVSIVFGLPPTYPVDFHESGLSVGTIWSVSVNGTPNYSSGTDNVVQVNNGTYPFTVPNVSGYAPSPSSGSVTMTGAPITIDIVFSPPAQYQVRFVETGLPAGTVWSVTFDAQTNTTATTSANFTVSNTAPGGSGYPFSIGVVSGFAAVPGFGSVTVNGANVLENVAFVPTVFSLVFTESGLPSGTAWSVSLNGGLAESSSTDSLSFSSLSNGTYSWSLTAPSGYTTANGSGSVRIHGGDQSVSVAFTQVASTGGGGGGSIAFEGALIGVAIAAVAVIGAVLWLRRGRRGSPSVGSREGPPPPSADTSSAASTSEVAPPSDDTYIYGQDPRGP